MTYLKTISKTFDNRDGAKIWIINNQLGRRNLTPKQSSNLRGMRYGLEKKDQGGDRKSSDQNDHMNERTAEKLAKEYGVSAPTIRRDAKFAEAISTMPPELKEKILDGSSGLTQKQIMAWPRLSEEKQKQLTEEVLAGKSISP